MARAIKKYKQLSCREMGGDCDYLAQAETEEQVMELSVDHGCFVHDHCDISPDAEERIRSLIRDVWA